MGRIRTIKPAFFLNEDIATLPVESRLLFIGLWCIADKQGRLVDRPKRIKAELYPYDNIDVEKCLNDLHKTRLINRYTTDINGVATDIIQVINFSKHQRCHHTEQDSQLPEFKDGISINRSFTVKQPLDNGEYSVGTVIREGKGKEGKGGGKKARSNNSVFSKPTIQELHLEIQRKGWPEKIAANESEKFYNHYESNGWKVGKNKMVSWTHAVAGWMKRVDTFKSQSQATNEQPIEFKDGN